MSKSSEKVIKKSLDDLQDNLRKKAEDLKKRIKEEADSLQKEGEEIEEITDRPILEIDMDVEMKLQTWKLHLPQVQMKEQNWKLHLPQVAMKRQEWVFHTPSTRMEKKKIGQYPEFYCDTGSIIPKCSVRWTGVYAEVPVPFMEEQRISLDIPEFTWEATSMRLHVPEFTWELTEMKLHVPEFTVRRIRFNWPPSIADEAKEKGEILKEKAKDLEKRSLTEGKKLEKEFRFEAVTVITELLAQEFSKAETELESERVSAMKKFADSLAMIKSLEETISGKENSEFRKQLEENRKTLRESQEKARLEFDLALESLLQQKKEAINRAIEQQGLTPEEE